MSSFTEDLFTTVLVRLPLKSVTTSKLVCKQWKSIVESTFFIELFMSHHQNSHSSWSLMCEDSPEVMAYYRCNIWGLPRTLGSYISSFITKRFKNQSVTVKAYSDVGLILICSESFYTNRSYYVANPISRQRIKIPSPPLPSWPNHSLWCRPVEPSGLATKIENNLFLRYKVVMMQRCRIEPLVRYILIYSSDTRLWSSIILQIPLRLHRVEWFYPVSLNGTLYCVGYNFDNEEVHVVSHDLFGESDRCRVILFPDVGKNLKFKRVLKASQGFLTYMNIVHETKEDKLCVWKLKSGEWQLVSETSLDSSTNPSFKYFPLAINPFDANKLYLWSEMHKCLTFINLHKGKFGLQNNLEHCSDDLTLNLEPIKRNKCLEYSTFVLPHWLYQIPDPRTKVTDQRAQDHRRRSNRARVPNRKYTT